MMESRMSQQTFESAHGLPQKQEWGLIYKHRAMQFQKAKSMQKLAAQHKKDTFREQLDKQIVSKNNVGLAEREQDKRYYQYVVKKAQQMKQKQEKDKFERFVRYKQLEEANQKLIEGTSSPKQKDKNVYNLQIGLKSQIQKKQRAEAIRKDVISTLDQQKQWKEEERLKSREKEIQDFMKNEAYQQQRFSSRANTSKKYEQNQAVYNYYKELHQQKIRKEKDLQYKLVSQVQQKKQEEQIVKRQANMVEKQRKNLQMKDTLEKQLQLLNYKRRQQKIANPEQNNYSFINHIFREKKPTFDKRQYSQFLQKQAEQQRLSKIQRQYMSEEQYKYNSNQLNKALSGTYTYDKYVDRSIGNLGNKLPVTEAEVIKGDDSEIVKARLEAIRNRNLSMVHSRSDMDRSFS